LDKTRLAPTLRTLATRTPRACTMDAVASAALCPAAAETSAADIVLSNAVLLEKILQSECLTLQDLANAAAVARAWRRPAYADAVWRRIFREYAPSLRSVESQLAGKGLRAAVARVARSVRLAYPRAPTWGLRDFRIAVDLHWRGQPFFAALFPLSRLGDEYDANDADFHAYRDLLGPQQRHALDMQNELGNAQRPDAADVLGDTALLALRMTALRSDGAVACICQQPGPSTWAFGEWNDSTDPDAMKVLMLRDNRRRGYNLAAPLSKNWTLLIRPSVPCSAGAGGDGAIALPRHVPLANGVLYFHEAHDGTDDPPDLVLPDQLSHMPAANVLQLFATAPLPWVQ
jgi:hypothetical protein